MYKVITEINVGLCLILVLNCTYNLPEFALIITLCTRLVTLALAMSKATQGFPLSSSARILSDS